MLFNSLEYLIFLPIVFILYWYFSFGRFRVQNMILILSSYLFYGWWDFRFLFLLIFSTLLDYYTGLKIHDSNNSTGRKIWLIISIAINLGFLGFFKYYNFFIESITEGLSLIGFQPNIWTLRVILPVGISFYTFHGLSYVLDIYYRRISPTRNFVDYGLFVCYFPLLVAGPIERATHLLPQVQKPRQFDYLLATDGLRQILWGLFKKVVIADNCAELANMYFNNYTDYGGVELFMGAVFFTFQIYGDFSGYSDIALGTSKLFGITLLKNFSYPYFSRDIAEFWRRWHISLSSWFKDYLYIPLGGSKGSTWKKVRNTFIIFLVSGFWHGANWTFIAWGLLNAIYFLPLLLLGNNRSNMEIVAKDRMLPSIREFLLMGITFIMTVFAWIFFRSETVTQAFYYIGGMFRNDIISFPSRSSYSILILLIIFIMIEWINRKHDHGLAIIGKIQSRVLSFFIYFVLIQLMIWFSGKEQQFIYFQF